MSRAPYDAATAAARPGPPRGRDDGVAIRPMEGGDVAAVLGIERASFAVPWSEGTFRGLLRRRNARLFVATDEADVVLGYAVLWFAGSEAELGDLAVREEARRRGIGRRLLAAILRTAAAEGATAVFLEVRESNEAACRLYETAGFEIVGRRPDYYVRPPEDALVMRCAVPR